MTSSGKRVKSHSTAQHSTAQHSTAQHSTALTSFFSFSDKNLPNRFVPINIEGIIAMQRSVRLSISVAFSIFAAIEQSMKVSERDFVILENLSLFLYWRIGMNKYVKNLADGQSVVYSKCLYKNKGGIQ